MPFANYSIALPVSKAAAGPNDGRAFIDRGLVGDDAASVVSSIAFAPSLLTPAQMAVQISA